MANTEPKTRKKRSDAYPTEAERKAAQAAAKKKWLDKNREKFNEYQRLRHREMKKIYDQYKNSVPVQ